MVSGSRFFFAALRWAIVGVAAIGVVIVVIAGALHTGPGRQYAAGIVAKRVGNTLHSDVRIEGVGGQMPFTMRVTRMTFQDVRGVWMTLENVYVDWSPGALIHGQIDVKEISAESVRLERLPQSGEPSRLPRLPRDVPRVTVRRFEVGRLALSEQLSPARVVLTASGNIQYIDETDGLRANILLNEVEGPPVEGRATLGLQTKPAPSLDVDVAYDEPQQGPVGHWLGLESGPVAVRVNGAGPVDGWIGEVSARACGRDIIQSRVRLEKAEPDGPERLAVIVEGRMSVPEQLLPPALQPILGAQNTFSVKAQFAPGRQLNVDNAAISSLLGNLKTSGNIDFNTGDVDIAFSTKLEDLAAVKPLIGVPVQGGLVAEGTVTGRLKQPVVNVTVQASDLKLGEAGAETFNGRLRFEALEEWEGNVGRGQFDGEGTLTNFAYAQAPLLPTRDFNWRMEGQTRAQGVIEVQQFILQNPAVTLTISGEYNLNTKKASFNLQFSSEEIRPISSAFGVDVQGATHVSAKGTADIAKKTGAADIAVEFTNLQGLPEAAAALLGATIKVTGNVAAAGGAPVFFRDVTATGAHARLSADGSYDFDTRRLDATAQADLPDLSVLEALVNQPLTGALAVDVSAEGTAKDLDVTLDARGHDVTVAGTPVELTAARAEFQNLPGAPQGRVRLAGLWRGEKIVARADMTAEPPRLGISDIEISVPGTVVTGGISASMDTWRLDGRLSGVSDDLRFFSAVVGAELSGSGAFEIGLHAQERRQDVGFQLTATALAAPWVAINRLQANADLSDVYERPAGQASLEAAGIAGEGFNLETFSARYEGGADAGTFAVETRGALQEPVELAVHADWRRQEDSTVVTLKDLGGRWGEYPLRLAQPAVLDAGIKGGELQAALDVGPGALRAEGHWTGDTISAAFAIDRLPLGLIRAAGGPGLSGAADGRIRFEGPLAAPVVNVDVQLTGFGALPPLENAPPVDVVLQAAYQPNRVEGTVRATRLFEGPVEGRFSAPLVLSVSPPAFRVPQKEPLEAGARFEGGLDRLASLAVLEDQQISGEFRGEIHVTGTPAMPVVAGEVLVSGASYENFETGTILRDLNARVVAENSIMRIASATATDGIGGTVEATGQLAMEPQRGFPIDMQVALKSFRIVRREDVTASATGSIDVTGRLSAMKLAGTLDIVPSDIALTQRQASPVEALQVVDVNVPPPLEGMVAALNPPAETPPTRPRLFQDIAVDLVLNVPGQAKVTGYGVDSEWKGSIHVTGTAAKPVMTGELTTVRGELTFAAKKFRVEEGTVSFSGLSPPDPVLNIAAQYQAREVTATFRISGPVSNPQIALESTPQLPEDEILARILFGRDLSRVSPVQALQLARAANTLATGREHPGLIGRLGHTLGLGGLAFQDVGKEGEIGLGFGRYLGKNIYLNVTQGFGGGTAQANIEIELTRRLTLESTLAPTGESGVSLNWKRDY